MSLKNISVSLKNISVSPMTATYRPPRLPAGSSAGVVAPDRIEAAWVGAVAGSLAITGTNSVVVFLCQPRFI